MPLIQMTSEASRFKDLEGVFRTAVGDQGVLSDLLLVIGRRRQRTALGLLLAARGQSVPVDRLVEAPWTERPPAGPGNLDE